MLADDSADLATNRRSTDAAPRFALVGALGGLTWSCALRGWMIALAGPESTLTWTGTLGGVLLPGTAVGGLLGWAELRRRSGAPTSPWLVASPALLALAPLAVPGVLTLLIETGQGSGALGMVSLAMLAGFSQSGRGRPTARLAAGLIGFAAVPALWLAPPMRPELDTATPYGALAAATFSTLFVTLALGCSLPMRQPHTVPGPTHPPRSARSCRDEVRFRPGPG